MRINRTRLRFSTRPHLQANLHQPARPAQQCELDGFALAREAVLLTFRRGGHHFLRIARGVEAFDVVGQHRVEGRASRVAKLGGPVLAAVALGMLGQDYPGTCAHLFNA